MGSNAIAAEAGDVWTARSSANRGRTARLAATLAAVSAVLGAGPLAAQSLMVGADGAIHLDEFSAVEANDPVVIEQQPQLVPAFGAQAELAGMPAASLPAAVAGVPQPYAACSVPFVPCFPAAEPTAQQPLPIMYSFFGEFLLLHPTGADFPHAQQQRGPGGPGTAALGQYGVADFHYEPGVRIGGDMALSPTTSLAATYTYFESNARSRLEPPAIAGGTVGSLVLPPGLGALGSTGPVDARSALDFQLADFEYRSRLLQGPRHWVNGGIGGRYAHLEQEFGQVGTFPGDFPGQLVTQTDLDFDGGGVRLALDGGRTLGRRGLSVYGRTSVAPVAGQFSASYSLLNDTTDQVLARVETKDDRIVTILDYEFGLAWTGPGRRWRLSAGYTASYWFNALTTEELLRGGEGETIMFDGLVTRIEHLW